MSAKSQPALFALGPQVEAAPVDERARAIADELAGRVCFGTSSWGFTGWIGQVWARVYDDKILSRVGLPAYAQHPLLRGVGLDRTHYAPITNEAYAEYAAQTPAHFRFLVKAHAELSLQHFPTHARYGDKRGAPNPLFLDAAYATDVVIEPTVRGLGDKLGALLFQFAAQDVRRLGGPERFAAQLFAFLDALPAGVPYAVEIRNEALLCDAYKDALVDAGVSHCLNAIAGMPSVRAQVARMREAVSASGIVVARWMLRRELSYEDAFRRYYPFNAMVDSDDETRAQLARVLEHAVATGRGALVTVNNKAEGCAPASILALAEALAARLR